METQRARRTSIKDQIKKLNASPASEPESPSFDKEGDSGSSPEKQFQRKREIPACPIVFGIAPVCISLNAKGTKNCWELAVGV